MYRTEKSARKRLNQCIRIDTLTPEQARVEVAKDVLAALKLETIRAGTGPDYALIELNSRAQEGEDLRGRLGAMPNPATVCGIGALFIAHVARFNHFNLMEEHLWGGSTYLDINREDVVKNLRGVFPAPMLKIIEEVYEGFDHDVKVGVRLNKRIFARFPDKKTRLFQIMLNIIQNDGNFVPSQLAPTGR